MTSSMNTLIEGTACPSKVIQAVQEKSTLASVYHCCLG